MTATLQALPKGHQFPATTFELSQEWVSEYVIAVEDDAISGLGDFAPPMAVAALSIRALVERAALPPGAIHLGQELAFLRAVAIGERLTARAEIANRGERRGWVLMAVELTVDDEKTEPVMTGRATVTFPLDSSSSLPDTGAPADRPMAGTALNEIPPLSRTLTQDKVNRYAKASGDHNPLHTDPTFASTTRFGDTIAHGMLILAYISEMMTLASGRAWLSSGRLKVRFRGAAHSNATVTASGRIVGTGNGRTAFDVYCRDQEGRLLVSGEAEVVQ